MTGDAWPQVYYPWTQQPLPTSESTIDDPYIAIDQANGPGLAFALGFAESGHAGPVSGNASLEGYTQTDPSDATGSKLAIDTQLFADASPPFPGQGPPWNDAPDNTPAIADALIGEAQAMGSVEAGATPNVTSTLSDLTPKPGETVTDTIVATMGAVGVPNLEIDISVYGGTITAISAGAFNNSSAPATAQGYTDATGTVTLTFVVGQVSAGRVDVSTALPATTNLPYFTSSGTFNGVLSQPIVGAPPVKTFDFPEPFHVPPVQGTLTKQANDTPFLGIGGAAFTISGPGIQATSPPFSLEFDSTGDEQCAPQDPSSSLSDGDNDGDPYISDATYVVNGKADADGDAPYVYCRNGTLFNLLSGSSYTATEIKAPPGYVLNSPRSPSRRPGPRSRSVFRLQPTVQSLDH